MSYSQMLKGWICHRLSDVTCPIQVGKGELKSFHLYNKQVTRQYTKVKRVKDFCGKRNLRHLLSSFIKKQAKRKNNCCVANVLCLTYPTRLQPIFQNLIIQMKLDPFAQCLLLVTDLVRLLKCTTTSINCADFFPTSQSPSRSIGAS